MRVGTTRCRMSSMHALARMCKVLLAAYDVHAIPSKGMHAAAHAAAACVRHCHAGSGAGKDEAWPPAEQPEQQQARQGPREPRETQSRSANLAPAHHSQASTATASPKGMSSYSSGREPGAHGRRGAGWGATTLGGSLDCKEPHHDAWIMAHHRHACAGPLVHRASPCAQTLLHGIKTRKQQQGDNTRETKRKRVHHEIQYCDAAAASPRTVAQPAPAYNYCSGACPRPAARRSRPPTCMCAAHGCARAPPQVARKVWCGGQHGGCCEMCS